MHLDMPISRIATGTWTRINPRPRITYSCILAQLHGILRIFCTLLKSLNEQQHPTLTGAEIIWATLAGEGVTTVFGYPGGAILPVYDALRKFPNPPCPRPPRARRRAHGRRLRPRLGRIGVCIATSGPGATNLVTGIATAMLDSIPIVCITGQVSLQSPRHRRLPGNRHHRHHPAHHQAQLPGHPRRRHRAHHPRSLPDRRSPAAPAPSSSTSPRMPSRPPPSSTSPPPRPPRTARTPCCRAESNAIQRGRRPHHRRQEARHPRRPRHHRLRRARAGHRLRRAPQIPVASTLLGLGAFPTTTRSRSA